MQTLALGFERTGSRTIARTRPGSVSHRCRRKSSRAPAPLQELAYCAPEICAHSGPGDTFLASCDLSARRTRLARSLQSASEAYFDDELEGHSSSTERTEFSNRSAFFCVASLHAAAYHCANLSRIQAAFANLRTVIFRPSGCMGAVFATVGFAQYRHEGCITSRGVPRATMLVRAHPRRPNDALP